ncbi:MAG: hypothetical protein NXH86_04265 [Flavobacteriaceae bacterium]|nr:hypothetical protein [Flavobacteriaceae bacterium]
MEEKNCAFQYYNGTKVMVNEVELTLGEAKELFNENYDDMIEQTNNGYKIEAAIWIDMKDKYDYHKTLIHISNPLVENGVFYEKAYIQPFS